MSDTFASRIGWVCSQLSIASKHPERFKPGEVDALRERLRSLREGQKKALAAQDELRRELREEGIRRKRLGIRNRIRQRAQDERGPNPHVLTERQIAALDVEDHRERMLDEG